MSVETDFMTAPGLYQTARRAHRATEPVKHVTSSLDVSGGGNQSLSWGHSLFEWLTPY